MVDLTDYGRLVQPKLAKLAVHRRLFYKCIRHGLVEKPGACAFLFQQSGKGLPHAAADRSFFIEPNNLRLGSGSHRLRRNGANPVQFNNKSIVQLSYGLQTGIKQPPVGDQAALGARIAENTKRLFFVLIAFRRSWLSPLG